MQADVASGRIVNPGTGGIYVKDPSLFSKKGTFQREWGESGGVNGIPDRNGMRDSRDCDLSADGRQPSKVFRPVFLEILLPYEARRESLLAVMRHRTPTVLFYLGTWSYTLDYMRLRSDDQAPGSYRVNVLRGEKS
jgi:hypothetical protein